LRLCISEPLFKCRQFLVAQFTIRKIAVYLKCLGRLAPSSTKDRLGSIQSHAFGVRATHQFHAPAAASHWGGLIMRPAGISVRVEDDFTEILNEGVARLKKLGFDPVAKMVRGQPADEIGKFAKEIEADLIVVGHRRQSAFDRWWSGPKGAYLMDYTDCSLLVARNAVSDEAIEAAFARSGRASK
jgi:nucleotide-binding universal stress UspA family protein